MQDAHNLNSLQNEVDQLDSQSLRLYRLISNKIGEKNQELIDKFNLWSVKVETSIGDLKNELDISKKKLEVTEARLAKVEKEANKTNLIIHGMFNGVQINTRDNFSAQVRNELNRLLNLDLEQEDIQTAFTLQSNTQSNAQDPTQANPSPSLSSPPIKVCLTDLRVKAKILSNRKKLQGTKVFINEDLPKEIREAHKLRRLTSKAKIKKKNIHMLSSGESNDSKRAAMDSKN